VTADSTDGCPHQRLDAEGINMTNYETVDELLAGIDRSALGRQFYFAKVRLLLELLQAEFGGDIASQFRLEISADKIELIYPDLGAVARAVLHGNEYTTAPASLNPKIADAMWRTHAAWRALAI
jgi:hypothetical protein